MSWTISKDFTFSASHQLDHLPDGHKCARLHGHNYTARVELSAEALDQDGFVLDYGKLDVFGDWVVANLDHRHLNDIHRCPTAEHLAAMLGRLDMWLWLVKSGVTLRIGVSETPKTWAWWRP